jgi:hypothetical protein
VIYPALALLASLHFFFFSRRFLSHILQVDTHSDFSFLHYSDALQADHPFSLPMMLLFFFYYFVDAQPGLLHLLPVLLLPLSPLDLLLLLLPQVLLLLMPISWLPPSLSHSVVDLVDL